MYLLLDPADAANPNGWTAQRIRRGELFKRQCIVLEKYTDRIEYTYMATFGESTTLPDDLKKRMWYPFKPAVSLYSACGA